MLEEAKQHCDYLIVGLQTDPTIDRPEKNKPVQSVYERYTQLKGCKYVDEIIPYSTEEDLLNLLTSVNYDVRILGEEYRINPLQVNTLIRNIITILVTIITAVRN
jgi:glycerol-3-phosphate cytidylyltransferase